MVTIGKALSGGYYPVSAALSKREVLGVFKPGDHGSTFGGNPLAAAIGLEALQVIVDEGLVANSAAMGARLSEGLRALGSPLIREVRGRGLMVGIEIDADRARARAVCEKLMENGILSKETHETVVRLAPPLIIDIDTIDWAIDRIGATLAQM
jgi:ornithine--oxo-acid transaminase